MTLGFLAEFYRLVLAKLQRVLRRLGLSSPEEDTSTQDYDQAYDQRINRESTPPPEEHIDLRCIWGIEFYTPSHVDRLEADLRQLGWGEAQGFRDRWDPVIWLQGLRRHRYSVSGTNLGPLTAATSPNSFSPMKFVPRLPHQISYAQGQITSLSPSLISIIMCFTLEESFADEINSSLRNDRVSSRIPIDTGYLIHDPYRQKREDIEKIRSDLRNEISEWFEEFIPGVFSTKRGSLPTCELIVSRLCQPFILGESPGRGAYDYLGLVGFHPNSDSWKNQQVPGLILDISSEHLHANISVKESDIEAAASDYGGNRSGSIHYLNQFFSRTLQSWAILPLLEFYTEEISRSGLPDDDKPENILNFLHRTTLRRSDIAVLSAELSDELSWIWHEAIQFYRLTLLDEYTTLGEELKVLVQKQADWLRETDRFTRENAAQYGSLLASVENIRLQKSLKRLTWVLAGLAVLAAVMPVIAAKCL